MDSINYQELAKEVIRQQQNKEQAPQDHKEAMISVLREKTILQQQAAPQQQAPIASTAPQTAASTLQERNLPSYAESVSPEIQQEVEHLISTTLEKGLTHGISLAAKADPFVIDMYHDALAEHIVGQMKMKGML